MRQIAPQPVAHTCQSLHGGPAHQHPRITYTASCLSRLTGAQREGGGAVPNAAAASCEVDVVAQRGHAWVEVKSHGLFGLHSTHWLGSAGHTKGEAFTWGLYRLV